MMAIAMMMNIIHMCVYIHMNIHFLYYKKIDYFNPFSIEEKKDDDCMIKNNLIIECACLCDSKRKVYFTMIIIIIHGFTCRQTWWWELIWQSAIILNCTILMITFEHNFRNINTLFLHEECFLDRFCPKA